MSLVEVVFSISFVATGSLTLVAAVTSQQRMNALARERSLAVSAVRAYMEAMRRQYPAKGSTDMSGLLYDTTTPADYVPDSGVEAHALRDRRGLVLKMTDELGVTWGPAASGSGSSRWLWTDATMTTVGAINTGTFSATPTIPYTFGSVVPAGATTRPSLAALGAMGYVSATSGMVCGRDLDGSATIANTQTWGQPGSSGLGSASHVDPTSQVFVPCEITLSWASGSGNESSASAAASRQRITIYAAFGPNH